MHQTATLSDSDWIAGGGFIRTALTGGVTTALAALSQGDQLLLVFADADTVNIYVPPPPLVIDPLTPGTNVDARFTVIADSNSTWYSAQPAQGTIAGDYELPPTITRITLNDTTLILLSAAGASVSDYHTANPGKSLFLGFDDADGDTTLHEIPFADLAAGTSVLIYRLSAGSWCSIGSITSGIIIQAPVGSSSFLSRWK